MNLKKQFLLALAFLTLPLGANADVYTLKMQCGNPTHGFMIPVNGCIGAQGEVALLTNARLQAATQDWGFLWNNLVDGDFILEIPEKSRFIAVVGNDVQGDIKLVLRVYDRHGNNIHNDVSFGRGQMVSFDSFKE